MPKQSGALGRRWAYGVETTWGTAAAAGSGIEVRRTSNQITETPDTYSSNEIRDSLQRADFRHGVRRVTGTLNYEMAPGENKELMESLLMAQYATGSGETGSPTITFTGTTIVRDAGSWITDGFKIGDVVRIGGAPETANNDINVPISGVTALTLTVPTKVDGTNYLTADAVGDASTTVDVIGQKVNSVITGHVFTSLTFEDYQSLAQEVAYVTTGNYIGDTTINIPGTGLITASSTITGKQMVDPYNASNAPYFTSVTAANDAVILSSALGFLRIGSLPSMSLLNATININRAWTAEPAAFEQYLPDLFPGQLLASGTLTFYVDDNTDQILTGLRAETEYDCHFFAEQPGTAPVNMKSWYFPRIKLGDAQFSDVMEGLQITVPFEALEYRGGSAVIDTGTVNLQDSALS